MASGVGKHKLLSMGPTEPWSVREKLCLATSVMKSGDQNWVSVSRAIKPFAEPGRPPDWFSQKHCASQYSELLETTETPKRKRGEKGEVVETVEDVIVRRLTAERIEELKRLIKDTQEKHRKLKKEAELIQAGHLDPKLEELWGQIVEKKKREEEEADVKRKATDTAYLARQALKNTPKRVPSVTVCSPPGCGSPSLEFCHGDTPPSTAEDPGFMPLTEACGLGGPEAGLGTLLDDSPQKKLLGQKATPPLSPLLSELLKKGSLLPTSPRLVRLRGNVPVGIVRFRMIVAPSPRSHAPTCGLCWRGLTGNTVKLKYWYVFVFLGGGEAGASRTGPGHGAEDDLVTVSYMGDELDLETVGDIIAIIEDKVRLPTCFRKTWFCLPLKDVKEEEDEGPSDGEEGSASETKEGDGGEEEEGDGADGAEAYMSEVDGETEPPASESEDGYIRHTHTHTHTHTHSIEDQEAIQAQKIWKKAIMLVWRAAANHRYANVFLQPVTDDIAPGYHGIVHRPMDLSTIKKNIETGLIRTTAEFQRDIMLMFQNAVMYNSSDHDVFHMALEMQRDVLEQIQQFLATQLIMQTSESGISAKSLRGRDSTRKQDPLDKDSVPMASPAFLLSLFDGGTRGRRCAIEADLKMKK
uniref:Bromodomain-containing protein 8 n=1 Tax=Esox lucius TaxID=8010 RepID=A0A6Q2XFQ3_ESOLU